MITNTTNYEEIHRQIPGQCWKCKDRSDKVCDISGEPCTRTVPICKPVRGGGHILINGD